MGTGFHDPRHYYASLLIRHGESIKTVQRRLGHATASETLDTYAHLARLRRPHPRRRRRRARSATTHQQHHDHTPGGPTATQLGPSL